MPYTTVYVYYTPGKVFQPRYARQPRGCQYRTIRLRKALGDMFSSADLFWHRHYSNCGDIERGKSAQERVMYTVLYGSVAARRLGYMLIKSNAMVLTRGGVLVSCMACSRMTIDPCIPAVPGRNTSGFHRPGRHCLHQARSAVRRWGESHER